MIIVVIVQVNALLETLDLTESVQRKGHFSLYNCLVLGHTKYHGVQRVYCNPFPAKAFYGSHCLDLVMIRPPVVDHGAFMVSPDSVWYALVLLLFSATSQTDTWSKTFCICAYFLSEIEVMHAYGIIMDVPEVTDHAHAARHGSQKGMRANNRNASCVYSLRGPPEKSEKTPAGGRRKSANLRKRLQNPFEKIRLTQRGNRFF